MTDGWQLQFRGRSRLHMLECWFDSLGSPLTRGIPGCGVRDAYADGYDGEWSVYVSADDTRRAAEEGLAFVSDPAAVERHIAATAVAATRCRSAAEHCRDIAAYHGVPRRELAAALTDFFDGYTILQGHYHASSPLFTAGAEDELVRAVSGVGAEASVLATLTYGDPSGLRSYQESVHWAELLHENHRRRWADDVRDARLARHAATFRHVGALGDRLGADPLDLCRQRWQRDVASPPDEVAARLRELREGVRRNVAERKRLIGALHLGDRERRIADQLSRLGVARLAVREEFSMAAHTAYPAFARVFAAMAPHLDAEEVRQMTRDEVVRVAAGETVRPDRVRDRLRRGGCRIAAGSKAVTSGAGPDDRVTRGPSAVPSNPPSGRLTGLVVSGNASVTGRARVLPPTMSREDQVLASENAGPDEILVVAMTYPAIVPACARVAGIITDFGGLTCHAAVIARAVGVPCVVGVRDATRTLRTGDLVRIDVSSAEVAVVNQEAVCRRSS